MRKVQYQIWVPKQSIQLPKDASKEDILLEQMYPSIKPGTGCWSEPQSGLFHQWGYEVFEGNDGQYSSGTIALIEDVTTGRVHSVAPEKMKFDEPEAAKPSEWYKQFSKEKHVAKVVIINEEELSKPILKVLLPVLNNINKKLDTL